MRRVYWQEGRKACRILCDMLVSDWISDCCLEFKAPEECFRLKKEWHNCVIYNRKIIYCLNL